MFTVFDIKVNSKMKRYLNRKVLEECGFKARGGSWVFHKCIYRYEDKPEIYLDVILEQDDENDEWSASGKVVDYKGDSYIHYYNRRWGENDIVDELDKSIDKILTLLAQNEIIKKKRRAK